MGVDYKKVGEVWDIFADIGQKVLARWDTVDASGEPGSGLNDGPKAELEAYLTDRVKPAIRTFQAFTAEEKAFYQKTYITTQTTVDEMNRILEALGFAERVEK